ncbi:MAG: glycosyltransferase family 2 protein [Candidatus Pacebacteria bacterium]|nr:glycosyltransferase family 2 protein [Candidatus Paceibacterota bacterium]
MLAKIMANNNVKISVIMSSYNGEKFIKEAISSILAQTFGDFEFLIVNDGSTDLTPVILEECARKDQRIKIITNSGCIGLTKSLNKAIKQARGEYIARMDDDDISLSERLAKQIDFMEKNPKMAVVGCLGFIVDERGEVIGEKKLALNYPEIKKRLLFNNQFVHSSLMLCKTVLDKEGFYNEKFKKAQDYELVLRLASKYPVVNLPQKLLKWRLLPTSLSWKNKEQQKYAILARWWAITRYGYPKITGLFHIIIRCVWLYVPKWVKMRKYK